MLTVFCYDVADNRNRRLVAKILARNAARVQKSVFEGWLTKKTTDEISHSIAAIIEKSDSLRVYVISATGRHRCLAFGPLQIQDGATYFLV